VSTKAPKKIEVSHELLQEAAAPQAAAAAAAFVHPYKSFTAIAAIDKFQAIMQRGSRKEAGAAPGKKSKKGRNKRAPLPDSDEDGMS
jgi:hypothetical protein